MPFKPASDILKELDEANARLQAAEDDLNKIYKDMGKSVAQVFQESYKVELGPEEILANKKKMEAENPEQIA